MPVANNTIMDVSERLICFSLIILKQCLAMTLFILKKFSGFHVIFFMSLYQHFVLFF
jgi:hypothetical protein